MRRGSWEHKLARIAVDAVWQVKLKIFGNDLFVHLVSFFFAERRRLYLIFFVQRKR